MHISATEAKNRFGYYLGQAAIEPMPLAFRKHVPHASPRNLCPHVQFEGDALVALPHFTAPFRYKELVQHAAACGLRRANWSAHSMP